MEEHQHALLAQIASMYYERDMTQNAIADELGVSRVKVYRLLKQAREENVVQIIIDWPIKRNPLLEEQLRQRFGLKDARVLENSHRNPNAELRRLGQLSARYLEQYLNTSATVAVCLGHSTYEVINAIRPDVRGRVQIAQAMGSMPRIMQELDSAVLARQLAHKVNGEVHYLSSPLIVDSAEAAAVVRNQRDIQRALTTARIADIALLGIGQLDPNISMYVKAGFVSADEMRQLSQEGAVGDLAGYIFTLHGELHPCLLNQRVIAITMDELRQIPTTLAVAMGSEKTRAILGALRTGAIKVLCTDDETANRVLELDTVTHV